MAPCPCPAAHKALVPGQEELLPFQPVLQPGLQQDVAPGLLPVLTHPASLCPGLRKEGGKEKFQWFSIPSLPDLRRGKEWKNKGASGFYQTKAQP